MEKNEDSLEETTEISFIPRSVAITGVKVAYYAICHTKLWLFSHHVEMERGSESVQIGKYLHEARYLRHRAELKMEGMSVDFVKRGRVLEIHEIKKSKSMESAHRLQLLFYLYKLQERGVPSVGYINYPAMNRRIEVVPTEEDFVEIEKVLEGIGKIVTGPMPLPVKKRFCRKCAYEEFCWSSVLGEE